MPLRRGRRAASAAVVVAATLTLPACFGEPEAPDRAVGARLVGSEVEVWLGGTCDDVTEVDVELRDSERASLDRWTVTSPDGVALETFMVGVTPDGFTAADPLEVAAVDADIAVATISRVGAEPLEVVAQVVQLIEDPAPDDDSWDLTYRGWTGTDEVNDLIDEGELAAICELFPPE